MKFRFIAPLAFAALAFATPASAEYKGPTELLNVSYDIARELYAQINPAFQAAFEKENGVKTDIKQSHGGSSKQARSILEGLQADVVTFNQVTDVQALADKGFVRADWAKALPNNASPYYSFPAFLVRKGNPKGIKTWDDLARSGVSVIFPNPKTSGNGRYTYLAAYAHALEANNNDQAKATEFVGKVVGNVPVFDTGGRGATTTFVERQTGDVLVTFETEVFNIAKEFGVDKFDVIIPPTSLLADFPVAVVDKVVDKRGTRQLAEAYLNFLYSDEGQDILAKNYNRVHNAAVKEKYKDQFPEVRLYTIDQFGGWAKAQKDHFAEGGTFDRVFEKK